MPKRKLPKGTTIKEVQRLYFVRCVTRIIGGKRFTFWQANGLGCKLHLGRGCHMKALSDAVRTAPVESTTRYTKPKK
jgi:hypothetical protein